MEGVMLQVFDEERNGIDMPPDEALRLAKDEFAEAILNVDWPLLQAQAVALEGIVAVQEMEIEGDEPPLLDGLCNLLAVLQAVAQTYGLIEAEKEAA